MKQGNSYILVLILIILFSGFIYGNIPAEERAALIAFYNTGTFDQYHQLAGWKTPPLDADGFAMPGTEDSWEGVTVTADHVTVLDLSNHYIYGHIPAEFANLTKLETLNLYSSKLSGSIPAELGTLTNLKTLHLGYNYLEGSIPSQLGNLVNLETLNLYFNKLSGSIPPELGNLSKLKSLTIDRNQLTGSIPSSLGNLSSLNSLFLNDNKLTGSIPPELANLSLLRSLYLDKNQLTGSIPSQLGNMSNLQILYLADNQLTGSIPPELGNLSNLICLGLYSNKLSGSIPPELGNLTRAFSLSLSNNQLTGSIPPELQNVAKLVDPENAVSIYLHHNQLTGSIPPEIMKINGLNDLYLNSNRLTGTIPYEFAATTNLSNIALDHNQLTGSIPAEFTKLERLHFFHLNDNQLTGTIPQHWEKAQYLTLLHLENNNLTGEIPSELGKFSYLEEVNLNNNQLTGQIPGEFGNLKALNLLNLGNNKLSGEIPFQLGYLPYLSQLYLQNNKLSGEIPSTLMRLSRLSTLNIDHNCLYSLDFVLTAWLDIRCYGWQVMQDKCSSSIGSITLSSPVGGETWEVGTLKPVEWSSTGSIGAIKIELSTDNGKTWATITSSAPNAGSYMLKVPDKVSSLCKVRISKASIGFPYDTSKKVFSIIPNTTPPAISLSRSKLFFSVQAAGSLTREDTVTILNTGGGTLNWTAASDASWLSCTPSSGINNKMVKVSVNATGLAEGEYNGILSFSDAKATNSPQTIEVKLKVIPVGQNNKPFGEFATPLDGSTVSGSIPVTGWALDDTGISGVKIYLEYENNTVYIGSPIFIEGMRPDIETAYPDYPNNNKAGWGYMMLTHFLPNNGNGTFVLEAVAIDLDGNEESLGKKTITVNNLDTEKPFGALDTPEQGGIISGSEFIVWGWALTPSPAAIPIDGSTIDVYVDGINIGNPTYNIYREDIAQLFPDYLNSQGAAGYFYLDTTGYSNGLHTISWNVTDNAGNTEGIGSRYFYILNEETAGDSVSQFQTLAPEECRPGQTQPVRYEIKELERLEIILNMPPADRFLKRVLRSPAPQKRLNKEMDNNYETTPGSHNQQTQISDTNDAPSPFAGYMVVGDKLKELPIGSTFDQNRGIFYWQPGPGFIGEYRFQFIGTNAQGIRITKNVEVKIIPR